MKFNKEKFIFDEDVEKYGSYKYTSSNNYSAKVANKNISDSIMNIYDLNSKSILDVGCGDGTYTVELINKIKIKKIHGIDISKNAIQIAKRKIKLIKSKSISFEKKSIYDFKFTNKYDVILFRGVIHHTKNPEEAIKIGLKNARKIIIVEPNGYNPILKILEKFSKYHIEHEEKSFSLKTILNWCKSSGNINFLFKYINLIPFFCPRFLVIFLNLISPFISKIPLLRNISFGQVIILCSLRNEK